MIKKHSILRILTAFLLLLCLIGCENSGSGSSVTSGTEEQTEIIELALFENSASDYIIVRGEDSSQTVISACKTIKDAFKDATGAEIRIITDFTAQYQKTDISKAIVVGVTDDTLTSDLCSGMKYNDYGTFICGSSVYIAAGSDEALTAAADAFCKKYLSKKAEKITLSSADMISYKTEARFEKLTVNGCDAANAVIVYDGTESAKDAAETLKKWFIDNYAAELKLAVNAAASAPCVIYVGSFSGSTVCKNEAAKHDRSNYYWAVTPDGTNLYLIGDGAATCDAAVSALTKALDASTEKNVEIASLNLSGDVGTTLKSERNAQTDVRVMTSNVLWSDDSQISTAKRCEYLTDMYLSYQIDVICFNEFYATPKTKLTASLSSLYDIYFPDYEDIFNGDWTGYTNDLQKLKDHVQATPVAVRKASGITYVAGGFRYTSEKWWIHSITWAVLKTADGKQFAVLSNHYGDQSVGNFAVDTLKCCDDIRAKYGDIPMVICGDLYSKQGETAYSTLITAGYKDSCFNTASRGSNLGYGTYHGVGNMSTGSSVPIDHILFSSGKMEALRYHIIINKYTKWASDHYSVYADLKIIK